MDRGLHALLLETKPLIQKVIVWNVKQIRAAVRILHGRPVGEHLIAPGRRLQRRIICVVPQVPMLVLHPEIQNVLRTHGSQFALCGILIVRADIKIIGNT